MQCKGTFLLLFVARSVTLNFERHKAFEVEREGTKPYRDKAERDGRGPFVGDIESDRTKLQVELVRLRSSVWLTAQRRKTHGS